MKKILTLVLSGIGYSEQTEGNAVLAANMNNFLDLWNNNPHTTLYASGKRLGLDEDQMGDSALSHLAIGSGRILKNNYEKVNDFLENYDTSENFKLLLSKSEKRVHLIGLCSDGNIHGSVEHLLKMFNILVDHGFKNIYFHLITDGRDTLNNSAINYINLITDAISEKKIGSISTICGRYYAMDRDLNYNLTNIYYNLIINGNGLSILNYDSAINACYQKEMTDENIRPFILDENGIIKNDDIVVWMNYREERSRQILQALTDHHFNKFETDQNFIPELYTFFSFDKGIKTINLINDAEIENPLGIYLSKLNVKQARIAETDKFPHVTYFFDGRYNGKLEDCDKYQIQTGDIDTLEENPEMKAYAVTKKIIEAMEKDYNFILATYANPDSVAHTGNYQATINACKVIDLCLEKIIEAAETNFYTVIILADQGNAEKMFSDDGKPLTTHTTSKVPFIITDKKVSLNEDGDLTCIAPTILEYMDISIPLQMTSSSLLKK